jgi:hypothetical protein
MEHVAQTSDVFIDLPRTCVHMSTFGAANTQEISDVSVN